MKKQKNGHIKGDWIELLKKDFEFMEIDFNEEEITGTPKDSYRKKIKDLIRRAAFKELTEMKNSKSKIKDLVYDTFSIQPYLKCSKFNRQERNLLYSLRARMHPAKNNFRKMYSQNLKCSLGCIADEDQRHIFENCAGLDSNIGTKMYDYIFEDSDKQKEAISTFIITEDRRRNLMKQADNL